VLDGSAGRTWPLAQHDSVLGSAQAPLSFLPVGVSDQELGVAVLTALSRSRREVPHPAPQAAARLFDPVLRLVGVTSHRAFERGSKLVSVAQTERGIVVSPSHTLAPKRHGYEILEDRSISVVVADADAVGKAVREAMVDSTAP